MVLNHNALFIDGDYDDAIIDSEDGRVVYSMEKVIECGINIHGSYEASLEWHEYNTFCAHMGEGTPIFRSEVEDG